MSSLLLRFVVRLERRDLEWPTQRYGPLFSKWLPNGKRDSIALPTRDPKSQLKVWFERRGYVEDRFIEFALNRKEVDREVMRRQAVLDGGPLFGEIELANVSQGELRSLKGMTGSPSYVAFGKRIVKLIQPPVSEFLDILRTNYGQYWIAPFEPWDSRMGSLGNYCTQLQLEWSLDQGRSWHKFSPTEDVLASTVILMQDFTQYLSERDWAALSEMAAKGFKSSLAAIILSSSHHLLDTGSLKHAFIEAVSALELAIGEFVRSRADLMPVAFPWSSWDRLRLPDRLVMLVMVGEGLPAGTLAHALAGIEVRNNIVHEGYDPATDPAAESKAKALLAAAACFLPGPVFRFPTATPGNQLNAPRKARGKRTGNTQ